MTNSSSDDREHQAITCLELRDNDLPSKHSKMPWQPPWPPSPRHVLFPGPASGDRTRLLAIRTDPLQANLVDRLQPTKSKPDAMQCLLRGRSVRKWRGTSTPSRSRRKPRTHAKKQCPQVRHIPDGVSTTPETRDDASDGKSSSPVAPLLR